MIHAGFPFRGLCLSILAASSGSDLSRDTQPEMMKLKSNQTRTYDGDGYKKRAACLCFRNETEQEVSKWRLNGPPGERAMFAPLNASAGESQTLWQRVSGVLSAVSPGLVSRVGLALNDATKNNQWSFTTNARLGDSLIDSLTFIWCGIVLNLSWDKTFLCSGTMVTMSKKTW